MIIRVYAGIGSVRLNLIRKWFQDLLKGLQDLHSNTPEHPAYIHGRIRFVFCNSFILVYLTYSTFDQQVKSVLVDITG